MAATTVGREYRKGNWSIEETLILITGKKMEEERRVVNKISGRGELRWKWVEKYCWEKGCHRSHNQCNDKWDNLLRDYKKVTEYQSQSQSQSGEPSYWHLDKHLRKERNLPSNMPFQLYQPLHHLLQTRYTPLPIAFHPIPLAAPDHAPPPRSDPGPDTSETDSEDKGEGTKRRKFRKIGSSIVRSASILARAMRSSEEKHDRRHREVMEIERRRLEVEEATNQVSREGISGLVAAVTNLSGAIESLVSGATGGA